MDITTGTKNVIESISNYEAYESYIPNNDTRDQVLNNALNQDDLSWRKLGAIIGNRGPKMGYLQTGSIEPLNESDFIQDISELQFAKGTSGWFFNYGMDTTGQNGFLFIVFRFPTLGGNTNDDSSSTIYNICGYVYQNGVKINISTPGIPLTTTGVYTIGSTDFEMISSENSSFPNTLNQEYHLNSTGDDTSLTTLVFDLDDFSDDANINVTAIQIAVGQDKAVEIDMTFKDTSTFSSTLTSNNDPVPHGDLQACAPCESGVGTNYLSYTYMTGDMVFTDDSSESTTSAIVGWFDHQWANFGVAPNSSALQIVITFAETIKPSYPSKWFWITLQLGSEKQYSLSIVLDESDVIVPGATFSSDGGILFEHQLTTGSIDFGVSCTVKVNTVSSFDSMLSSDIDVTVVEDGVDVTYTLKGMGTGDGQITLISGTINQEIPSIVYDSNGDVAGIGFIEMNNFHTTEDNIKTALGTMGMDTSSENIMALTPKTYTLTQAWKSVSIVSSGIIIGLLLICLIVWGIVVIIRKI